MAKAELSRRKFLQLSGAAVLAWGAGEVFIDEAGGEFLPIEQQALGAYLEIGPSGEPVGLLAKIVGVKNYNYIVESGGGLAEVPVEHLKLLEGWPFPKVGLAKLGIRNDVAKLMDWPGRLGATMVRINVAPETIGMKSETDETITAAITHGLKPLILFNPPEFYGEEYFRERIRTLLWLYPNVNLEIGNEPDNPVMPYWKDRDLSTYAMLVKVVSDEAKKNGFRGEMTIASLVDVTKEPFLLGMMKNLGLNLTDFRYGRHEYQTVEQVSTGVWKLRNYLRRAGIGDAVIDMTELGVNYVDKKLLMPMIDQAWKWGVKNVFIHELPSWMTEGQDNWGLVNSDNENATRNIFDFAAWARKRAGK